MSKKVTGVFAYLGPIFWLIAFLAGDKEGAKIHLNQGLVLVLGEIILGGIGYIPYVGGIISGVCAIAIIVFDIMGIVYAATDKDQELPLIGQIKILK